MEKFSFYQFKIIKHETGEGFVYEIYNNENELIRESNEWYEDKGIARLAAIGHIHLLENGEG